MDENKSIWDSLRPKWRDVAYACMGLVGGAFTATRLPKYFEGVMDGYQRKQAKLIAEELRKPDEPYKTEN